MAFISDLSEKSIIDGTEYMIIEDNESTKKIKTENLLSKTPTDIILNENNKVQLTLSDGTILGNGFSLPNVDSSDAKQIEMIFDGVFVKWRYVGDETWTNLFSITDIKGSGDSSGGTTVNTDVSFKIGTVTTLPTGENATAVIEEISDNNFVLSLGLPRGEAVTVDGDGIDITNQVKTNIDKNSSEISVIVKTNNNYVYGVLSSLELLTVSAEVQLTDYNVVVSFRTQNDIPMKFNQSTNIYMVGDDCLFGAFIPRVSTDYRIEITYGGQRLLGKVYGASYGWVANLSDFTGGSNIVSVAKTYIDNASKLCYGNTTILSSVGSISEVTDSTGKYYIDCSTLTSLAYRGIKYSDSKYSNWSKTNDARTSLYSYAIELPRTASEQAKYCVRNGWVLPKESWGENFSKLKEGDLIFYAERPTSKVSSWGTRYMKVGHVALCIGIINGVAYSYEATSSSSVNGVRTISIADNTPEKICMIARPQLTVSSSGNDDYDVSDTPTEDTENMLEKGNISSSNGSNSTSNLYVRTKGYIDLGNIKGIKLNTPKDEILISNIVYYNDSNVFISTESVGANTFKKNIPTGAKKVRFTFRKADNTPIEPYEVDYNISYVMSDNIDTVPVTKMTFRDFPRVTGKITDNYHLVAKLNEIVEDFNTMYVYGAIGQKLSRSLITDRANAYPWFYTSSRMEKYDKAIASGKLIWSFDCVNLIEAILWGWSGDSSKTSGGTVYESNGVPDTNADGFFNLCNNKKYYDKDNGDWSSIEIGEAVWMKGHIGVYVGEGLVIECTPSWSNNVQITGLGNKPFKNTYNGKSRVWSGHGKIRYINYLSENPFTATNEGVIELKGNTYTANISTCGIGADINTTYSEAKSILDNLKVGKGVGSDNYQNAMKWEPLVNEIAPQFGLDPSVVMMIISAESGGVPTQKTGADGGYGLMQVERSVFVKGYTNPYTGKVNSGVQTLKYLNGKTEKVILSMDNLNGNTDRGRRLQIKFGCHETRENARKYYWNFIHTLVANNMGAGALNFICSKYVCEKYGYKLVNSGSLSKQCTEVQKKVKEVLQNGDLGYLAYRKWYTETGHTLLKSGPGTANNVELYMQYYKIKDNQLPYFYDDNNQKISFENVIKSSSSKAKDLMGNTILGYPNDLVCSAPSSVPLGSKVLIQGTNTEFDGKIFTVMNRLSSDNTDICIYMKDNELANSFDNLKGTVLVGDIINDGKILITTGNCNVRTGNSTSYDKIGYTHKGFHFTWLKTMSNGWNKVDFKGKEAYISGTYSSIKEVY